MAGLGAFDTNGPPVLGTTCNRKLDIMGFSYERGVSEMVENLGHRTEGVMYKTFGGTSLYGINNIPNLLIVSDRFTAFDKKLAGKAGCGNIHYPYNGTDDYDWSNTTNVSNRCDDWLNYPSTKGTTVSANCSIWNCDGYTYKKYWFTHLPYAPGTTNGKLNNWWAYIVDYDNAVAKESTEKEKWYAIENGANDSNLTGSTGSEIYIGANQIAKFNFTNVAVPKNTVITDAYLEFVTSGPYSNTITENITLSDGTTTTAGTSWNINTNWTTQTIVKSPSITSAVQQLINSGSWASGKNINVNINHLSGTGERRVFAFEREAMAGARLVVKIGQFPTVSSIDQKINSANDDFNNTCSSVYPNEVYFGVNPSCSGNYEAYFVFRDVRLAKGATVTSSYIEFVEDGPYSGAITEAITVTDGTTTSTAVNWPITVNWPGGSGTKRQTPSLNSAIQTILNSTSWEPGKSLTFKISHVSGGERRVYAYERDANSAARLLINTETPKWSTNFTQGWYVDQHVRTTGDVNNDGKDDLVGFKSDGVYVGILFP